jgi:glycine cleavage system aminomethyltransferase T
VTETTIFTSRRLRRTPFHERVVTAEPRSFTVYNDMLLPMGYGSPEDDYWHLLEHVQIWDVAAQRQVEVAGPDALRLVAYMTPRAMASCAVGQCRYVPLADDNGGVVNDPIALRLAEDRFWLSLADSDVLLWAKGLAHAMRLDVTLGEPDVSPLAVQGPKAEP